MRIEAHPGLAVALERLDLGGMQARGAGAGVDLGAQAGHAEVGQGYPLAQANHSQMVKCLQIAQPA
ncbi:hypothetical protein D3C81_1705610 [compost metagenome]